MDDLRQRRQTESALARSMRAVQLLSRCNEAVVGSGSEEELLTAVCRIAVDIGGFRLAWVGYAQTDADKTLVLRAWAGAGNDSPRQFPPSWHDDSLPDGGPLARVISSGEAVALPDLRVQACDAPWLQAVRDRGFRDVVCLPVKDQARTFGVLVLHLPEALTPAADEPSLLQNLVDVMAFGITSLRARATQQDRQRSRRLENIGRLAGGIAHDLNNELSPILLSVGLLRMGDYDDEQREVLDTIEASAARGAEMVGRMLALARGADGRRVDVRLHELVEDLMKIVRDTFPGNIRLDTRISPDLWLLHADPAQIHQTLLELCVNARDAMPDGGQITLRAENMLVDEGPSARESEALPGPQVMIEIEDRGPGIPDDMLDKIFDPFFTTKEAGGGAGLGLASSLAIVKRHGGRIRVQSDGTGTRVRICLPAKTPGPEPLEGDSAGAA